MKISEHVYVLPKVVCNIYIIEDPDGLTIIDTGIPGSAQKILKSVAGLGKSAQDVKRILITHSDIDHVGSLKALQQATGARTYASQIEAQAIAVGKVSREIKPTGFSARRIMFALMRPFFKVAPFQVDEIVTEGQTLPILGGLQVLDSPGHTPGHISFFSPTTGVLFCGDSMIVDENRLQGSRPGVTWDAESATRSVQKQSTLGAKTVCSGHGPAVYDPQFPKG